MADLSPMMQQYHALKQSLPSDVLLFFRLGDFYEMFYEDARTAADILKLTLTKRQTVPMAGVPFHAAPGYIRQLIRAGKRVALAEQTSEPIAGKLTQRQITQVISAGSVSDVTMIDSDRPLYLAAVYAVKKKIGLAYVDHTTGEFRLTELNSAQALDDEILRLGPSEVLYSADQEENFARLPHRQIYDSYAFSTEAALFTLKEHFRVQSLDGFGCSDLPAGVGAAGAILHYLRHQLQRPTDHLRRLRPYQQTEAVILDAAAQSHLELVQSRAGREATLWGTLDHTVTPMGTRLLRDWILRPLRDLAALEQRQLFITALMERPAVLSELQATLKEVRDIERTLSRLSAGGGNARDLQSLALSLQTLPAVQQLVSILPLPLAQALARECRDFGEITREIEKAIVPEPPATIKDGGLFQLGHHPELDELRSASTEGKNWIAQLQSREIDATGIKSLKIRYNGVFGYFIEVTKSNLAQVPAHYHRKQTTVNSERYITPELKEIEDKILGAEERSKKLEYELYHELRQKLISDLDSIQSAAQAIAQIDVLAGLAEVARLYDYRRPVLSDGTRLFFENGRHPVLDQQTTGERFVPNDADLDTQTARLVLLTGPNMAGKSTYIRQVALLTLMAQIGSFLPVTAAEVGLVDRIFTRVGASDDLSRGQSTFMVEMNETALIINNATADSLVILDEIGRGTSTFDGLSIAWSIAEHLHDQIGCRTLFATHYHELTHLAHSRESIKNANVAVREWNDQVIFLRKIIPGAADKSYGIHVARLAGLPADIIHRAQSVLQHLESQSTHPDTALTTDTIPATTDKKQFSSSATPRKKSPANSASITAVDLPPPPQATQLNLF